MYIHSRNACWNTGFVNMHACWETLIPNMPPCLIRSMVTGRNVHLAGSGR